MPGRHGFATLLKTLAAWACFGVPQIDADEPKMRNVDREFPKQVGDNLSQPPR
jgi:hypothetical protein